MANEEPIFDPKWLEGPAARHELWEAAMSLRLITLSLRRAMNAVRLQDFEEFKKAVAEMDEYDNQLEKLCNGLISPQETSHES